MEPKRRVIKRILKISRTKKINNNALRDDLEDYHHDQLYVMHIQHEALDDWVTNPHRGALANPSNQELKYSSRFKAF